MAKGSGTKRLADYGKRAAKGEQREGGRNWKEREEMEGETWFQLLKRTVAIWCCYKRMPHVLLQLDVWLVALTTVIVAQHSFACNWQWRSWWLLLLLLSTCESVTWWPYCDQARFSKFSLSSGPETIVISDFYFKFSFLQFFLLVAVRSPLKLKKKKKRLLLPGTDGFLTATRTKKQIFLLFQDSGSRLTASITHFSFNFLLFSRCSGTSSIFCGGLVTATVGFLLWRLGYSSQYTTFCGGYPMTGLMITTETQVCCSGPFIILTPSTKLPSPISFILKLRTSIL